jgi:hypothetical protein
VALNKVKRETETCTIVSAVASIVSTGVADGTDWAYWSHLETLFKSIPSSSQTANEDEEEEDFSAQLSKAEETVCGMETFHFWLIVASYLTNSMELSPS